ncbi:hypothetical protein A6X20_02755 [Bradyrhizobium elkanii]|nr:hypothetical protein A6X20_02755 [Bradyrhizobium elkanii]ODM84118.1 hypothetical protein A6452_15135 [Bradyrhizobium elkanii]
MKSILFLSAMSQYVAYVLHIDLVVFVPRTRRSVSMTEHQIGKGQDMVMQFRTFMLRSRSGSSFQSQNSAANTLTIAADFATEFH